MGFSRQEYRSGVPLPSPTKELRHIDKERQQPSDFELGCCPVKLESILFSFLFTSTKLHRGGRKKNTNLCEIRVLDVDPPFVDHICSTCLMAKKAVGSPVRVIQLK